MASDEPEHKEMAQRYPMIRVKGEGAMPYRLSTELPDDVGTVFVTNVPGAPFQVMGRRDPSTGELCVRYTMIKPPGMTEAEFLRASQGSEIVTGEEAERLIHEIYTEDHRTGRAPHPNK
jgi:hypothetical protein